ncbi:hypothetical protein HMPREF9603_01907 [Cutibacterium acnes HL001PA1]|nr:hypothetical protein HMPREF9603_01907 [Cutibacterium acnes HL001PA1]MCW5113707.1 hypothetical protein [Cutibacterium acnes P05]
MQHPGAIDRVALFQVTHDAPQKAIRDLDVLGSDAGHGLLSQLPPRRV